MIEWISLALAVDAESKANEAVDTSNDSARRSRVSGDTFLVVRPVELLETWVKDGYRLGIFPKQKRVLSLAKKPFGTYSIRRSDILGLEEHDFGSDKYVKMKIREEADIWLNDELQFEIRIPSTIEQVTKVLNGQALNIKS